MRDISFKEISIAVVIVFLFLAVSFASNIYADELKELIGSYGAWGMVIYTLITLIAVMIAPVSTLPLLPVAAALWGAVMAAVLSVIGWTVGAIAAFTIARKYGYPVVKKIVSLEKIEKIENAVPEQNIFWVVVLLRVALPVDILSYALGLFTKIRFWPYTLATFIGVTPFAFVFAYAAKLPIGYQAIAGALAVVVLIAGYRYAVRKEILKKP